MLPLHLASRMFVGLSSGRSDSGHSARQVLLKIVPVKVACASGEIATTYALLDAGSRASLILESFAKAIGLEGEKSSLTIVTVALSVTRTSEMPKSRKRGRLNI